MVGDSDRFPFDQLPVALDPRLWVCEGVADLVETAPPLHLAVVEQRTRSDEEAEAADELEEEIEDAVMEIGYLIDAGMADDGNEDAVIDAMEGRIILQACDAVESFRAATAA